MKANGTHEGCIEQLVELYKDNLYGATPRLDEEGRIRTDYKELEPAVQDEIEKTWNLVENDNINTLTDFASYRQEFLRLFGFDIAGVDYEADVDPVTPIANVIE